MNQESISFIIEVKPTADENLMLINYHTLMDTYTLYVGITPHVLVKSDFPEFIIHSDRLSVSTVLKLVLQDQIYTRHDETVD